MDVFLAGEEAKALSWSQFHGLRGQGRSMRVTSERAILVGLALGLTANVLARSFIRLPPVRAEPEYGRSPVRPEYGWHLARDADPAEGITEEQRAAIERLRSLGYLSGSQPYSGQSGVTLWDTELAYNGLNLWTDGARAQAVLMDMAGKELHRWHMPIEAAFPGDRKTWGWRRVRLLENGDLLAIYEGVGLIRIDRESRLLWAYPGDAHHDLDITDDGLIYVLTREAEVLPRISKELPVLHDFVAVLASDGTELRRISLLEAIERSDYSDLMQRAVSSLSAPGQYGAAPGDIFHTNTLEILDGSLGDRLPPFRAGNVLVSVRQINTIAVLNMKQARITWAMSGPWVMQHQPTVLANGNILLFDNLGAGGRSRVIEFDPTTQEITWSYDGRDYDLFSRTVGTSQRLPNGNTIITESDYGRAIEVTPSKQIVWEFRTPSRAGDNGELIATLYELQRLEPGFPLRWLAYNSEE